MSVSMLNRIHAKGFVLLSCYVVAEAYAIVNSSQEVKDLRTLLKQAAQQIQQNADGRQRIKFYRMLRLHSIRLTPPADLGLVRYGYDPSGGSQPTLPRDVFIQRRLEKLSGHMQVANGRQNYLGATNWEAMAATSLAVHNQGVRP